MIAISCTNISKSYGIEKILDDISININLGEKVGLIGKNGAGKTTLFNVLSGELSYESGSIYYGKGLSVGYLKQMAEFESDENIYDFCLSVFQDIISLENRIREFEHEISNHSLLTGEISTTLMDSYSDLMEEFEKKDGYSIKSKVQGILKGVGFSDVDFSRKVSTLSGGQKSRLSIAKLLLTNPDILFLDEPTNHLDINGLSWLESYLSSYSGTVVLITHDRYFLDKVSKRIVEIENKKTIDFPGNYSDFMDLKNSFIESQIKEFEKQQKVILKQEEIVRRFKQHGTEKLAKRAKSREKALEKIEVMDKPIISNKKTKINFSTEIKSGHDVLKVENLSKSYDGKKIFENLDFDIFSGDIIGFIGPNGIGKSTILKIIAEKLKANSGTIKIGHNVFTGYYDQEQSDLNESNTLIEEISDLKPNLSNTEIRTLLGSFLFMGDDVFKTINLLSGGEKGRISLLKLMLSKSNLLLLDEPTNHLDIPSKEALENAILNYDGTILVVSHDRYFLNKICTKIYEVSFNCITAFLGNYDYYFEKIQEQKKTDLEISENNKIYKTKTQIKEDRKKEKEKLSSISQEKKKIQNLENEILELENKIHILETDMCKEEIYTNHSKSLELSEEIKNIKDYLEKLYLEWEFFIKNI